MKQPSFDLAGGSGDYGDAPLRESIGAGDQLPPGPYAVGLTHVWFNGKSHDSTPYTVVCGDGRAIVGHIESRDIAAAVADAMNRVHPS